MFFDVTPSIEIAPTPGRAFLVPDNWDDWFKFETSYFLFFFDNAAVRIDVGPLKIGQFGLKAADRQNLAPGFRRPAVPGRFEALDANFFSLGQTEDYYRTLSSLPSPLRSSILTSLNDCAFSLDLFDRAFHEPVMQDSLLRSVQPSTVKGRFHRLSQGNAELTPFRFSYQLGQYGDVASPVLDFSVIPESLPPTNLHVLIGRNGVGKTTSLGHLTTLLMQASREPPPSSTWSVSGDQATDFSSLISVAFSAFDPFIQIKDGEKGLNGLRYAYVGLKSNPIGGADYTDPPPKSLSQLTDEFLRSLESCSRGITRERWERAVATLETDPLFEEAEVRLLVAANFDLQSEVYGVRRVFERLSSGHKIVLLTITRLVELVDEKSLVLLDEPEAHLHPPLLASFLRTLSNLLVERNGIALIATHSPVVLQEVPRSCVWRIRRSGDVAVAERPEIETFGENVGILTREVFGLEVSRSGFHNIISNALRDRSVTYDILLNLFQGQLGAEAKSLAMSIISARDDDGDLEA